MAKVEVVIATFEDESKADTVLESLKQMEKERYITVRHAATIVKDKEGEIKLSDVQDVDSQKGKRFGAITGGLIGLLGGPIGLVVGAAAGAATGKAAAKRIRLGVPNNEVKAIERELQPGSSAIITYAEISFIDAAVRQLEQFGGTVFHYTIEEDMPPPEVTAHR
jgi:uncharacterized membrane protein